MDYMLEQYSCEECLVHCKVVGNARSDIHCTCTVLLFVLDGSRSSLRDAIGIASNLSMSRGPGLRPASIHRYLLPAHLLWIGNLVRWNFLGSWHHLEFGRVAYLWKQKPVGSTCHARIVRRCNISTRNCVSHMVQRGAT